MKQLACAAAVLLVTGCYGATPITIREDAPRREAIFEMPYLTLARCAVREYDTISDPFMFAVTTGKIREFPDDGYAEVIIGQQWTTALAEFRRVDEGRTAVRLYVNLAMGGEELTARMDGVHKDCAEGRRTGKIGRG